MSQGTTSDPGKSILVAYLVRPLFQLDDRPHGSLSADGQIAGTHLPSLLDTAAGRGAILAWPGLGALGAVDQSERRQTSLERLADAAEAAIDLAGLP